MIQAQDLVKAFGGTIALDGATMTVADGERVGILGPSGSGKTTLLRVLAGLERPDGGQVRVDGVTVSTPAVLLSPHQRHIGFVFQAPTLWPHMTVAQHVAFGLNHLPKTEARQRIDEMLTAMSLNGLERRHPWQLSGGQARLVALARTLAPRPRHLLMDEPLANVDPALKTRLLEAIDDQVRQAGCSLTYVTHDGGELARLADRVLRLENGQLVDG
jgi:iron(III) transport system ATP-binding protein